MTKPSGLASAILLTCVGMAYLFLQPEAETSSNAVMAARIVGVGLLISTIIEYNADFKNIIRADILALLGLYFLTLYEFLFAQEMLNRKISPAQAYGGLELILTGFFFLVIGRHLFRSKTVTIPQKPERRPDLKTLLMLIYLCFGLGFLYILMKVNFNVFTMIEMAMRPRFAQPWARGKYGGSFVFLSELYLFTYAVPPLAGILLNYRKQLSTTQLTLVIIMLSLTLFMGFAGGTRNVFFSYLVGLMGGYILSMKNLSLRKLIVPGSIALVMAYAAATYMFQFRSIGLKKFLQGQREKTIDEDQVYVDHNLYTIGLLAQSFPANHDFLGMEVFTWALVKPIPRVLWPEKPEGLSVSMEAVAGIQGYTLASTYVGESYMAGGTPMVIFISLLFGYLCAWWNSKGHGKLTNEELLIYALGLFAVVITMRSLFMFTTAVLPVIGVSLLLRYLKRRRAN